MLSEEHLLSRRDVALAQIGGALENLLVVLQIDLEEGHVEHTKLAVGIEIALLGLLDCTTIVRGLLFLRASRALLLLLALETPEPLYLGVDDEPAKRREVLQWLAERLAAPAPRAAKPPRRKSDRPRTSKRCSNRLLRAAGWQPGFPSWREGYEALIPASD